ncbi:MAG: ABC transporter permease, partial [Bacteroidales bacterium]|nr:ABC transporter permease [Candidatus Sodaliphilus fimicaballi]
MRKGFKNILTWPKKLCYICAHELKLIFGDAGVVIFFVLVSMAYPIVYSLVYNTEIPRDIRVVVVDDDRSQSSREFVRALDATPEVAVVGYCANMAEARRAINEHE